MIYLRRVQKLEWDGPASGWGGAGSGVEEVPGVERWSRLLLVSVFLPSLVFFSSSGPSLELSNGVQLVG